MMMPLTFANKITIGRILAVPFLIATLLYYSPQRDSLRFVALAIFLFAVVSDVVDGYIARTRHQKTPAGIILDPLADKLLLISAFLCLYVIRGDLPMVRVPLWLVVAVISRDVILITGGILIYLTHGNFFIEATRWGKTSTFFQVVTVITLLLQWTGVEILWIVTVFFVVISAVDYLRQGVKLLNLAERPMTVTLNPKTGKEGTLMLALAFLLSYLLGAIPTAFLVGKMMKGIDIRHYGSGNVGATNTFRVLGKGPGTFVLFFDILKGLVPVVFIGDLFGTDILFIIILLGLTAIIGHNWTVFLRFKGGKGIATSLGVILGLGIKVPGFAPVLLLIVGTWGAVFLLSGFVSLASLSAAVAFPFLSCLTNQPMEIIGLGVVCCLFITLRHRSNIKRLLAGQERRVRLFSSRKPS